MTQTVFEKMKTAISVLKLDFTTEEFATFADDQELSEEAIEAVQTVFSYISEKKQQATVQTLLKLSRLPKKAPKTFETFDFSLLKSRDLDRIRALPSLGAVYSHRNLAFIGPPGTGKTHLAQAFGYACCQHGMRAYFIKASELRDRFTAARRVGKTDSCLITAIVAIPIGSSWSAAGTIGVALMGIGMGLGVNPAMTAGAVVSGAYLGDKMSPMSDTTNLAPAVAEADLFDHIKSMMYTTGPAFVVTLIVYGLLGLQYDASSVDSEMVTMMTAAIQENFHMNILLLLPAVAVIVMAVCKCPSIPTLMVSTLVAVVLAMLVQGQSLSGILNILDSGYSIDTALPEFNRLVNRGGLQSMLWTAALGILGMLYGSIMEKTGLLEALLSKMAPLLKSTGGLVTAVVLTCTLLLMATASQTLAIVVGGRMYIGEFKKKNLLPQTLSRTLEDSGTIISPLVPWSLCGAYMAGTLGVSTMSYLPFAMFCWLCPVLAIVYGFTGKFFWKTGEKSSQKIYQPSTLMEAS